MTKAQFRRGYLFRLIVAAVLVTLAFPLTFATQGARAMIAPPRLKAGSPQPVHDAFGNPVRTQNGNRINYLVGPDGFIRVELGSDGTVLATQHLSFDPYDGANHFVSPLPLSVHPPNGEMQGDYLARKWKTSIWGTGIGASGLTVLDIDDDGITEVVAGAGFGFGDNRFWYILSDSTQRGSYEQEWTSRDYIDEYISRIVVADGTNDGQYEIYVALSNGDVEIYDAVTRSLLYTLDTIMSDILGMAVTDVDGDGEQEIVLCTSGQITVYSAETYQQEWQTTSYGGGDVAVADVDTDASPEIVTTHYVIDGISHSLEWDYSADFGFTIQLADIDDDNMAEIVGAEGLYWVRAYDADLQSLKWEIPADLDVQALRVGDIDEDNVQEVIYGDGQWGYIHCHDSITLQEEWYIDNPEHGVTNVEFGDSDNDGIVEVLWGAGWTSTGPDYLFVGDINTQTIEWQSIDIGGPLTALDVADVDSDGTQEIVMVTFESDSGYDDGIIFVYNAETYELEWQSDPVMGGHAWTGVHALKVADVDDDNTMEIVIGTDDLYDGVILVFDGITHDLEWQTVEFDGAPFYALAVADVDNDGQTEVIGGQGRAHAGAEGVYVRVFDGNTGAEEWHTWDLGYWVEVYNIEVADSDGDGNPEIAFGVDRGSAYVYDGVTQVQDWQSSLTNAKGVAVQDIDEDDDQEILVGTTSGMVYAFDGQTYAQEWSESLSSQAITSMRMTDMDRDGDPELVHSDFNYLFVRDAGTRQLIWQSEVLGTSVGNGGHLVAKDIDNDIRDEVVIGSDHAMYVFTFDLLPYYSSTKEVDLQLAAPGDRLNYTIDALNFADVTMTMTMTDVMPTSTIYVSDSLWVSKGDWELVGDTISWTVDLQANEMVSLTFAVTVELSTADGFEIINTAAYSSGGLTRSCSASTIVDALPPESVILHPGSDEIVSGTIYAVEGTSVDAVSGVDLVELRLDDGNWQAAMGTTAWTYSWTLPITDNWVTITARATDYIGHVEDPGPSVAVFVDNLSPYMASTSPAHADMNVLPNSPVVITFSEPIVSDTLAFLCQPDPGGWSIETGNGERTVILSHSPFSLGQMYSFYVSQAEDRAGHSLVPGPAPNPWSFMTRAPCQAVEGVETEGPAGLMVGETGMYTATALPPTATHPLTYTWDNGTVGPTAAYSWTLPGTYTLSVTVTNSCSEVVGSFVVEVQVQPASYRIFLPLVLRRW